MSRLWVFNYDYEFSLAGRAAEKLSRHKPWALLNRSSWWMAPLLAVEDLLLVYQSPPPLLLEHLGHLLGFVPSLLVCPPKIETNSPLKDLDPFLQAAHSLGLWGQPEPLGLMRHINSKAFSYQAREELLGREYRVPARWFEAKGQGPADLERALLEFEQEQGPLLVKDPFGSSGAFLCYQPGPSDLARLWAWAKQSGGLLFEQKLEKRREESLHFDFQAQGWVYRGRVELHSTAEGGYLGSRVDQDRPCSFLEGLTPLLLRIHELGYQGPLGLDLLYGFSDHPRLLEINARWTMGRMALEWKQRLRGSELLVLRKLTLIHPPDWSKLELPSGVFLVSWAEAKKTWVTLLFLACNEVDLVWKEQQAKTTMLQASAI